MMARKVGTFTAGHGGACTSLPAGSYPCQLQWAGANGMTALIAGRSQEGQVQWPEHAHATMVIII